MTHNIHQQVNSPQLYFIFRQRQVDREAERQRQRKKAQHIRAIEEGLNAGSDTWHNSTVHK